MVEGVEEIDGRLQHSSKGISIILIEFRIPCDYFGGASAPAPSSNVGQARALGDVSHCTFAYFPTNIEACGDYTRTTLVNCNSNWKECFR